MADKQAPNMTAPTKENPSDTEENNASEHETEEPTLPAQSGKVTRFLATTTMVDQKAQATELYKFLTKTTRNLSKLNMDNHAFTVFFCLANSGLIKVIYSIGYGCSGIGNSDDTDDMLLVLPGEGGGT
eukprot:3875619-Ditylum_brightwellii.AAC.1